MREALTCKGFVIFLTLFFGAISSCNTSKIMPLSTKRFVISNSGLNSQGFRMLTAGAVLEGFIKNPVLLFNHIRPEGNAKNQILPIGHWQDIKVEGDDISGVPFFDDKDDFAMQIFHKVEGGHIRACSVGAEPLETSKKKSDLLPGQTLATVTKYLVKEASICDIGANPDALNVALYDSADKLIQLSDTSIETLIPKINPMAKKTKTAAEALAALKKAQEAKKTLADAVKLSQGKIEIALADDETTEEEKTQLAEGAEDIEEMSDDDKDKKIEELQAELSEVKEQLTKLQDDAKLADDEKEEQKATALADRAHLLRKITLAQKPDLIKLAKSDYAAAEKFLAGIKAAPTVRSVIDTEADQDSPTAKKLIALKDKSFDELFRSGELPFVKLNAPDQYKTVYKAKFNKDPK